MAISPARKIAYEVLRRVESEGAYASDLLHAELGAKVKPADAALATELTLGVLRQRLLLDFLLGLRLEGRSIGSTCRWRSRCGWVRINCGSCEGFRRRRR